MKRLGKIVLVVLAGLLALILIGPLVAPVPALEGIVPIEQLANPDSQFVDVDGVTVHYKEAGRGDTALLLLHGFASSTYSWREVMEPLAEDARVVAFDRPAFGLTERPMPGDFPNGVNPYTADAQADLTVGLMDELGGCGHLRRRRIAKLGAAAAPHTPGATHWPAAGAQHPRLGLPVRPERLARPV